jgi:hypothetical protein
LPAILGGRQKGDAMQWSRAERARLAALPHFDRALARTLLLSMPFKRPTNDARLEREIRDVRHVVLRWDGVPLSKARLRAIARNRIEQCGHRPAIPASLQDRWRGSRRSSLSRSALPLGKRTVPMAEAMQGAFRAGQRSEIEYCR